MATIPNMTELAEMAIVQAKDAEASLTFIKSMPVVTNEEYGVAVKLCADVKDRHSAIDEKRKSWVEPLNAVVKDINKTLGVPLNFYAEAETVLKAKIIELNTSRTAEISRLRKESSEASKAGDTEKAEALIAQAEEIEVPKLDGLGTGETWMGEVEDEKQIPREYMIPDLKKLKALTKNKKVDPEIPGWRAYSEGSATITASKVER